MTATNYYDFEYVLQKLVEKQSKLIDANESGDPQTIAKARAALDVLEREARKAIRSRKDKGLPLSVEASTIWLITGGDDAE